MLHVLYVHLTKAKHIHKKPILSSERILREDYDRKGSVVKKEKTLVVSLKRLGGMTN
jgi:hypothetical protein